MADKVKRLKRMKGFFSGAAFGWLIPMALLDPVIAGPPLLLMILAMIYQHKINKAR